MRITKTVPLLLFAIFILISCQEHKQPQDTRQLIAEKIQYDVFIKNPNPDYDWWIENLPGPQRENLLEWIFEMAESGEMQAYDYFDKALSPEEVRNIGVDTIYQSLQRTEPPFDTYDTMITTTLEKKNITKIRFLEKWYFNGKKDALEKEVIGIAPVLERKDESGNFLANHPLFWIYFEEK